jgi:hypothetical protein
MNDNTYLSPIYRSKITSYSQFRNKTGNRRSRNDRDRWCRWFPSESFFVKSTELFSRTSVLQSASRRKCRLSSVFPVQTQVRNLAMRPRWLQLATHCQADPRVYAIEGSIENFPRDSEPGRNEIADSDLFSSRRNEFLQHS